MLVVSRKGEAERELQITLQDDGGTPDADTIARLLKPFEEGRRSLCGRGGVGVSRYVATAIVEAHGGTLTAEAAAPGGAIYRATLPLREP